MNLYVKQIQNSTYHIRRIRYYYYYWFSYYILFEPQWLIGLPHWTAPLQSILELHLDLNAWPQNLLPLWHLLSWSFSFLICKVERVIPVTQNKCNQICKGSDILQFINIIFLILYPPLNWYYLDRTALRMTRQKAETRLALSRLRKGEHQSLSALTSFPLSVLNENVMFCFGRDSRNASACLKRPKTKRLLGTPSHSESCRLWWWRPHLYAPQMVDHSPGCLLLPLSKSNHCGPMFH